MYGIIGEDDSDAATLKVLVRRLAGDAKGLTIKTKGYNGCAEMLRKGAAQIKLFARLKLTHFIIAYDSDGFDPAERRKDVISKVVGPADVGAACCVLIPVQEIEAWILADLPAVSKVFTSWQPAPIKTNPELIRSPKEHLERLSRAQNRKPIYDHATHNERVAEHLDLDLVAERCASFVPLVEFVRGGPRPS